MKEKELNTRIKEVTAEVQGRREKNFVRNYLFRCLIYKSKKYKSVMQENEIGTLVLRSAIEIHKKLGPGLLESAYQKCMIYELKQRGLSILSEVKLPLMYKNIELDCGYRLDILVEEKVILELKTVEKFEEIHTAQLLTYLKLTGCKLGYLLNFNSTQMKYGIKRVVNKL